MTLDDMKKGDTAVVTLVRAGTPALREKYHARGLVPGARVSVLKGGDPLVVALDESRWAIAGHEACNVEVAVLATMRARRWRFPWTQG